jgi:anhydro-N-acetylmuramic acid kinase
MRAIGLMSGTSLDGIDAAVIETDGETISKFGPWLTAAYDDDLRERLRAALGQAAPTGIDALIHDLTIAHEAAVSTLLSRNNLSSGDIEVIGFHGHTIDHRPGDGVTWQIGDGALLAESTKIDVVCDFRTADVAAGGQGAPFASLFHQALCAGTEAPVCVLNIGGISNVTWIGGGGEPPIAFDCGPGNGLIDEWVHRRMGIGFDAEGRIASSGRADPSIIAQYLAMPYFKAAPPKSLDRLDFDLAAVNDMSTEDGAATLTALTCEAIALAVEHLPEAPQKWLVTGGGRHNPVLMKRLAASLDAPVRPVEDVGWNGDALEAQAFGFLAVRSLAGLPLSLPSTTGVAEPMVGGNLCSVAG